MADGRSLRISRAIAISGTLLVASVIGATLAIAPRAFTEPVVAWGATQIPAGLSDGDLVFRTGRDLMARLVLSQGASPRFSHVGIIVTQGPDVLVVHALPRDGAFGGAVVAEPITSFASTERAADVGFYQVRSIEANARQRIRDFAMRQIGKPFDDDFAYSDDDRFYCTELALKALAAGGVHMLDSLRTVHLMLIAEPVVPPDSLRQSDRIDSISLKQSPLVYDRLSVLGRKPNKFWHFALSLRDSESLSHAH